MKRHRVPTPLVLAVAWLALAVCGTPQAHAQSITVIYPNGGETWVAGETYTITWTADAQVAYVGVELLRNGDFYEYLGAADTLGSGSVEWTVCDLIGDGADYTIRARSHSLGGLPVSDVSDAPFAITGSARPTFQVISPDGGEVWAAGTRQTITWISTDPVGDVAVWLDYAGTPQTLLGIVPMDSGALPWRVGKYFGDAPDYSIRLTWSAPCGPVDSDASDAPFSIAGSPPQPTLVLTRPNGGESWVADTDEAITWSATNPTGYVEVWLTDSAGSYTPLGMARMATGQHNWPILPCVADGTDYRILLRARLDGQTLEDISDADFALTGSFSPTFTITSPATGASWTAGSNQTIAWTSNASSGEVDVTLDTLYLGRAAVADGQLPVTIPPAVGDGSHTVTVQLTACGGYTNSGTSKSVSVTGSVTPTLTLTSPVGGEIWTAGTPHAITWDSTGLTGYLDIYLPNYGPYQSGHAMVPVENGMYVWHIPQTLVWPPPSSPYHPGGVWIISYESRSTSLRRNSGNIDIIAGAGLFGDLDADDDIDLLDLAPLQAAFTGDWPLVALGPCSAPFDFEPDGDVDFDDAEAIWDDVTGPAFDDVQEVR